MFTKSYKQFYNPSKVVCILFINKENDRRSDDLNIDKNYYIIERQTTGHLLFRIAAFQVSFPINFRIILLDLQMFYVIKIE